MANRVFEKMTKMAAKNKIFDFGQVSYPFQQKFGPVDNEFDDMLSIRRVLKRFTIFQSTDRIYWHYS